MRVGAEPLITRLLHEQALVTEQRDGYVANDYVVDRVVKRSDRPLVPLPVWRLATDMALESFIAGDEVRLWNVGVAAYGENAPDIAIRAMRAFAAADDPNAMFNLGVLLQQRGDPEAFAEAETWWRRAAQHDQPTAMFNLGALLQQRGDPEALAEAETWYRRAAHHNQPSAMVNLGLLLQQRGQAEALNEAEIWYRRAAHHNQTDALFNLGALLQQRGDEKRWLRPKPGTDVPPSTTTPTPWSVSVCSSRTKALRTCWLRPKPGTDAPPRTTTPTPWSVSVCS